MLSHAAFSTARESADEYKAVNGSGLRGEGKISVGLALERNPNVHCIG
jgi:hypothetical protein